MMAEQFDLFPQKKAKEARDRALKRVEHNNTGWLAEALRFCETSPALRCLKEFTAEDLRLAVTPRIGSPRSPHAWGLLSRHLLDKQIIVPTGKWVHMKSDSSHARRTPQYRWHD